MFQISVLAHHIVYRLDVVRDSKDSGHIYANDDEPFLQLISETYADEDLVEWTPTVPPQGDPNEPGYMGKSVIVPPEKKEEAEQRFKENEFNVVASELMSLNRTLADNRYPEYKKTT